MISAFVGSISGTWTSYRVPSIPPLEYCSNADGIDSDGTQTDSQESFFEKLRESLGIFTQQDDAGFVPQIATVGGPRVLRRVGQFARHAAQLAVKPAPILYHWVEDYDPPPPSPLNIADLMASEGLEGLALGMLLRNSEREVWELTAEGSERVMSHPRFGKFYMNAKGEWWTKDLAGHGGSSFKVYKQVGNRLVHVQDADKFGDYIIGKHKGPVGETIPLKEFFGG